MTDTTGNTQELDLTELDLLKEQATSLGLNFHPNIGLDKLKTKISEAENAAGSITSSAPVVTASAETRLQLKNRLRREAGRLVRVRVACMNPAMKEHTGAIYSVGNSAIGTFKKFVQFNTDDGWHVPHIIYTHMKSRKCQIFVTKKNEKGQKTRVSKIINELSVELLPDLTEQELKDLATQQAVSQSID